MREKYYQKECVYTETTFEDAVGDAEPLNDAIGRIAMNFASLEDEISSAITYLLKTPTEKGLLITSEMSFRAKVNILSSLMQMEDQSAGLLDPFSGEDFDDLLYMCRKSEELRNKLLHSSWVYDHSKREVRRRKLSAKNKKGFVREEEPFTTGQVLDIADYIIYTAMSVEEFFAAIYRDYKSCLNRVIYA